MLEGKWKWGSQFKCMRRHDAQTNAQVHKVGLNFIGRISPVVS